MARQRTRPTWPPWRHRVDFRNPARFMAEIYALVVGHRASQIPEVEAMRSRCGMSKREMGFLLIFLAAGRRGDA